MHVSWFFKLFRAGAKRTAHSTAQLRPREQAILQRELAESRYRAMPDTGSILSDAPDMTGLRTGTKIDLSPELRTHNGSVPNVGLVSPGPSENRGA